MILLSTSSIEYVRVENELIFVIRKNIGSDIGSENIVLRELLSTLTRAIQARSI
jgi:hypothetical protein